MSVASWSERLSPDLTSTFRRFPLAIALETGATAVLVALVNEWVPHDIDDSWMRALGGLTTGAIFAMAGALFRESRPDQRTAGIFLAFVLPPIVAASTQIRDTTNFVPYLLPLIGVFWLSVAAFTDAHRAHGDDQQHRFWWLNHRAFTSAALAVAGLMLVVMGCFALQSALSILFRLETRDIFWRFILPVAGGLLAPVYWLSTIPALDGYEPKSLSEPDFISRAIGFLGQFIMAPILIAYAAILLAYTVEIAVTQQFPQGMLGWMVLGFITTGAATWLLLYPPFMRERMVVRFFRRFWFWLTIVPLALFAVALWTRVAAYGLTPERIILLAGGAWGALLTLIFLLRRGDIRMIPALAGLICLLLSLGPWNVENGPRADQAQRLDAALSQAGANGKGSRPQWPAGVIDRAKSAVAYLINDQQGRVELLRVLARHDIAYDGNSTDSAALLASAGVPAEEPVSTETSIDVVRGAITPPTDLTATPFYLGPVMVYAGSTADIAGRHFGLVDGNKLKVSDAAGNEQTVDLDSWVNEQGSTFETPSIDFDLGGLHYRLAMDKMTTLGPDGGGHRTANNLTGTLFVSSAAAPLKPSDKPGHAQALRSSSAREVIAFRLAIVLSLPRQRPTPSGFRIATSGNSPKLTFIG